MILISPLTSSGRIDGIFVRVSFSHSPLPPPRCMTSFAGNWEGLRQHTLVFRNNKQRNRNRYVTENPFFFRHVSFAFASILPFQTIIILQQQPHPLIWFYRFKGEHVSPMRSLIAVTHTLLFSWLSSRKKDKINDGLLHSTRSIFSPGEKFNLGLLIDPRLHIGAALRVWLVWRNPNNSKKVINKFIYCAKLYI